MSIGPKFFILGVLLAVLIVWEATQVSSEDDAKVEKVEFDVEDCKKVTARIAKRILKAFAKCTKQLKANTTDKDEFERKLGCAVKCTFSEMNLLNAEGKVGQEQMQNFMNEYIPLAAHEFAHALSSDCNEEYGTKLDPNQETCESYKEYATCLQNTVADFADKTHCHPGTVTG